MYCKIGASGLLMLVFVINVESHWLTPCGYVYNVKEYIQSRIFSKTMWHELQHLTHKVIRNLENPELNVRNDFPLVEENWIPSGKMLQRFEGFRMPSKILKDVLPQVFRGLQISAIALHVNYENMKDHYADNNLVNLELLNKIMKINAQMICQADLLMRKYNVQFESISSVSEQYSVPSDWLEYTKSGEKTRIFIRQNEILLKYKDFLIKLNNILSE